MTVSIVPRPRFVSESGSRLALTEETVIACDPRCRDIGRLLQERLRASTGRGFHMVPGLGGESGAIEIGIDPDLAPAAYELTIDESGARLRGGDEAGAFSATQVLLQLLPTDVFRRVPLPGVSWVVPGVHISDEPRFPWRGMLLDVSRHFFGRDSVFKLLDVLALHRMNVLHLHLTDDQGWRIEINRYPALTDVGSWRPFSIIDNHYIRTPGDAPARDHAPHDGYFTQDDLREIVAYAARRYITVVPEIDLPGHSQAAIAAYPDLGNTSEPLGVWTDWGINTHVLNVADSTIEFYKNVLDEVLDVFPSTFIHIGGDEVPKDEWRESPAAQARRTALGLENEERLQSWLIGTFEKHLAERGRRLVGWDEILEGGLPAGATVMSWRGTEGGVAAANAGHDVIMSPYEDTYLYHAQTSDRDEQPLGADSVVTLRHVFEYDPMPPGLSEAAQRHVLGAQAAMWTEFVSSQRQMHQMVFPRLCAFAEAVWRSEAVGGDSFAEFEARMVDHRRRLHAMDVDGFEARGP
jgi:hexosaminidase